MWQKFKEQLPAVILTALLVIGGAFWFHQQTVNQMNAAQEAQIARQRESNDTLKAASDENRRQIEATASASRWKVHAAGPKQELGRLTLVR